MIVCVEECTETKIGQTPGTPEGWRDSRDYARDSSTSFIRVDRLAANNPLRVAIEHAIAWQREMGDERMNYDYDGELPYPYSSSIYANTNGASDSEVFVEDHEFPLMVEASIRLCIEEDGAVVRQLREADVRKCIENG
jgi:hypothetical protein